jgi:hypothetical protein
MAATPTLDERLIAVAAAIMGRKGGRAKSAKKVNAGRANGKKGGRPKKTAK